MRAEPVVAVAVAFAVVAGTLAVAFPRSREDVSALNPAWNGASSLLADVRARGEAAVVADIELAPRDATALVVLSPARAPDAGDAAALAGFAARGARLLVADDFGRGNAHLEAIDASSRVRGDLVLDLVSSRGFQFPVARANDSALTPGELDVVLDYASALDVRGSARIVGTTTASAWIDEDGDGLPGAEEERGPFAWAVVERVGESEVLVLSDPSVLINGLAEAAENALWREGVAEWLASSGGRVVIVEEETAAAAALARAGVASLGPVPAALAGAALGGLALAAARRKPL